MAEQHIQILKGLGLSDDEIKTVESLTSDQMKVWKADDPEALKIFNPGELVKKVQTGMKTSLSNDAEFLASIPEDKIPEGVKKKLESGQYARFQNELVEVATKKLGLEDKILTPEDRKSIKGLVEKMAVEYAKKNNGVEGLQEMQGKLSKALQDMEELKTTNTEALNKELEKVNGAHTAKLIKTLTKVELSSLEGVKLGVAAGFISDPVLASLSEKYTIHLDANDNLELKQKDNPKLDAIDAKGKKITFKDALKEAVLTNKLGVEEKVDPADPKKKKIIVSPDGDGNDTELVPSYIQSKVEKNTHTD